MSRFRLSDLHWKRVAKELLGVERLDNIEVNNGFHRINPFDWFVEKFPVVGYYKWAYGWGFNLIFFGFHYTVHKYHS